MEVKLFAVLKQLQVSGYFQILASLSPLPLGQEAEKIPQMVWLWWERQSPSPAGNQTLVIQYTAGHFTYWVITAKGSIGNLSTLFFMQKLFQCLFY
jgi:hypothetical protein